MQCTCTVTRIAQSVQRGATGWPAGDLFLVGAGFFAHVQTGPWAHPVSCTMGTGSFSGYKAAGV
jgi:hypothetical protein